MFRMTSKRLLQTTVATLGLIPVVTGAAGVLAGPEIVVGAPPGSVDLDSHFRFLSGIFLGVGLTFYATIPSIERKTSLFRLAAALVFAGGIGRLISLPVAGVPEAPHLFGLAMELLVVPALVLWQTNVSRRASKPAERQGPCDGAECPEK